MGQLRLAIFFSAIMIFMLWQFKKPFTQLLQLKHRLAVNFSLIACSWVLTYIVGILVPLHAAYWNSYSLNLLDMFYLSGTSKWIVSFILLDLTIYWQHRLFHEVPFLWRLHKAHHSDPQLDTSSALRFHPFEIIVSMLIKTAVVLLLGVPLSALIVFEIVLNFVALFHHSNIEIPAKWENTLSRYIVTPDLHRIHHSTVVDETNSNYCFTSVIWDKLFRSYKSYSKTKLNKIKIGLDDYPDINNKSFSYVLKTPFH